MMDASRKKRFSRFVKTKLTPLLGELGFEHQRAAYVRQMQTLSWMIFPARSRFDSAGKIEFTLDVGVYVPGVVSTYLNRSEPARPDLGYCCVSARLGLLHENKLDVWWNLEPSDIDADADLRIASEIRKKLVEDAMPLLERFQDQLDVVQFLERPREAQHAFVSPRHDVHRLAYAGILCFKQGKLDEAASFLSRAKELAANGPLAEHISRLYDRLAN